MKAYQIQVAATAVAAVAAVAAAAAAAAAATLLSRFLWSHHHVHFYFSCWMQRKLII